MSEGMESGLSLRSSLEVLVALIPAQMRNQAAYAVFTCSVARPLPLRFSACMAL